MRIKLSVPDIKADEKFVFEGDENTAEAWDVGDGSPIPDEENDIFEGLNVLSDHQMKIIVNRLVKMAESSKTPIFVSYFSKDEGKYVYRMTLPEEVGLRSQFGKFDDFMRICVGFNKEKYLEKINTNK